DRGSGGVVAGLLVERVGRLGGGVLRGADGDRRARRADRDVVEAAGVHLQTGGAGRAGKRRRDGVRAGNRRTANRSGTRTVRADREPRARGGVTERVFVPITRLSRIRL